MVQTAAPEVLLVLQPVTPRGGAMPPSPRRVLQLQELAKRQHPQVRVIPQVHRLMEQM
jgi:organic radical activating enzyme